MIPFFILKSLIFKYINKNIIMGLDVKKILDDLNPSAKVMKWIIVILFAAIATVFGWGMKRGQSLNDVETLKQNYKELSIKVEMLEKNTPKVVQTEVKDGMNEVKIVVFKEINALENELTDKITLVVESQGEVTKEWLLKAIDIRERSRNTLNLSASYDEVKAMSISNYDSYPVVSEKSVEKITAYTLIPIEDSAIVESRPSEEVFIADSTPLEEELYADTLQKRNKKKFILFRLFNKNK